MLFRNKLKWVAIPHHKAYHIWKPTTDYWNQKLTTSTLKQVVWQSKVVSRNKAVEMGTLIQETPSYWDESQVLLDRDDWRLWAEFLYCPNFTSTYLKSRPHPLPAVLITAMSWGPASLSSFYQHETITSVKNKAAIPQPLKALLALASSFFSDSASDYYSLMHSMLQSTPNILGTAQLPASYTPKS